VRVIVTRPEQEAPAWAAALRERGFDAVLLPLIRILPAPRPAEVQAAWQSIAKCRAVMFVSGNAVRHFFAGRASQQEGWPVGVRAWATGPGTRQALADVGVDEARVDAPPAESAQFDSETLWQQVRSQVRPGDEFLIVRGADSGEAGGNGRDWLARQLADAGAQVATVAAYLRTGPVWSEAQRREAAAGSGDAWLFSSSQAIANLRSLLPGHDWSRSVAVATHPRIAQAAREAGFGVVCESRPELGAVRAALESIR
jgi:uroporphyrinogen-III synthase